MIVIDGNGGVMVREFDIVVPLTLPSPGRVENEINKFSPTLTPKIPTQVMVLGRVDDWGRGLVGFIDKLQNCSAGGVKPTTHPIISNFRHRHFLLNQQFFLVKGARCFQMTGTGRVFLQ